MASQLENAMALTTLEELIFRAKNRGLMGVAVWNQGSATAPHFVAGCMDRDGRIVDPRSWDDSPTIEGALQGLETAMSQKWGAA